MFGIAEKRTPAQWYYFLTILKWVNDITEIKAFFSLRVLSVQPLRLESDHPLAYLGSNGYLETFTRFSSITTSKPRLLLFAPNLISVYF
jgi:hypothetical protein